GDPELAAGNDPVVAFPDRTRPNAASVAPGVWFGEGEGRGLVAPAQRLEVDLPLFRGDDGVEIRDVGTLRGQTVRSDAVVEFLYGDGLRKQAEARAAKLLRHFEAPQAEIADEAGKTIFGSGVNQRHLIEPAGHLAFDHRLFKREKLTPGEVTSDLLNGAE